MLQAVQPSGLVDLAVAACQEFAPQAVLDEVVQVRDGRAVITAVNPAGEHFVVKMDVDPRPIRRELEGIAEHARAGLRLPTILRTHVAAPAYFVALRVRGQQINIRKDSDRLAALEIILRLCGTASEDRLIDTFTAEIAEWAERDSAYLEDCSLLAARHLTVLRHVATEYACLVASEPAVLLHGDFAPRHLFRADCRAPITMIDLEQWRYGDAAYDVATLMDGVPLPETLFLADFRPSQAATFNRRVRLLRLLRAQSLVRWHHSRHDRKWVGFHRHLHWLLTCDEV
jgi:hypothetical protein